MEVLIKDRKVYLDKKYSCDTDEPKIVKGTYKVRFAHVDRFNAMMPILEGTPNKEEVLICWCKELCNLNIDCLFCDSIRVGRRSVKGELISCRETFNQLYYKMRHSQSKAPLTVKIE